MEDVVVGLDLPVKNMMGVIMKMNGEIVRQEKFRTDKENLRSFLEGVSGGAEGFGRGTFLHQVMFGRAPSLENLSIRGSVAASSPIRIALFISIASRFFICVLSHAASISMTVTECAGKT